MRMRRSTHRVSSEAAARGNTIASQTAALIEFARSTIWKYRRVVFEDEGYSGATL